MLPQPWQSEISDLMVADLGMDWRSQLEELEAKGCARFYGALEDLQACKDRKPAKVIPFIRPTNPREDS